MIIKHVKFFLFLIFIIPVAKAEIPKEYIAQADPMVCPEVMSSDSERAEALKSFLVKIFQDNPNLTTEQAIEARIQFLRNNNCNTNFPNPLDELEGANNVESIFKCKGKEGGEIFFSKNRTADCTPLKFEDGWINFMSDARYVLNLNPSTIVRNSANNTSKIWMEFYIANPENSEDGRWKYNYVRQITIFHCESRQQELIQGAYYLDEIEVYRRSQKDAIIEEIEPGTLANNIFNYVC